MTPPPPHTHTDTPLTHTHTQHMSTHTHTHTPCVHGLATHRAPSAACGLLGRRRWLKLSVVVLAWPPTASGSSLGRVCNGCGLVERSFCGTQHNTATFSLSLSLSLSHTHTHARARFNATFPYPPPTSARAHACLPMLPHSHSLTRPRFPRSLTYSHLSIELSRSCALVFTLVVLRMALAHSLTHSPKLSLAHSLIPRMAFHDAGPFSLATEEDQKYG